MSDINAIAVSVDRKLPIFSDGYISIYLSGGGRIVKEDCMSGIRHTSKRVVVGLDYKDIIDEVYSMRLRHSYFYRKFAVKVANYVSTQRGWMDRNEGHVLVCSVFFGNSLVGYIFKGVGFISVEVYSKLPSPRVKKVLQVEVHTKVLKLSCRKATAIRSSCGTPVFGVSVSDTKEVKLVQSLGQHFRLESSVWTGTVENSKGKTLKSGNYLCLVENVNVIRDIEQKVKNIGWL